MCMWSTKEMKFLNHMRKMTQSVFKYLPIKQQMVCLALLLQNIRRLFAFISPDQIP